MARGQPYPSGNSDCITNPSLLPAYWWYADLRLHHLQPGIEFMSAHCAVDAIRFDNEFIGSNPHATAIWTAGKMDSLIAHCFVLSSVKTIDRLSIEQPWPPLFIDDRQDEIMMIHVVFQILLVRETIFDQLVSQCMPRREYVLS